MRRLSSTLRWRNTSRPSGTWAMPRAATVQVSLPWISAPSNTMVPVRGVIAPAMVFSKVVLPAPFAPSTLTILPSATARLTPRSAITAP